jgi:hypothetical protein
VEALMFHSFPVLLGILSEYEPRLLVLLVMVLARAIRMDWSSYDWFRVNCLLLFDVVSISLVRLRILNLIFLLLFL